MMLIELKNDTIQHEQIYLIHIQELIPVHVLEFQYQLMDEQIQQEFLNK